MIFFLLPEIRYGIGLMEQIPNQVCIVTSHQHQAVAEMQAQGQNIICLEAEGLAPVSQAHQMLELDLIRARILEIPKAERKILTFKITPRLSKLALKLEAEVLMPPYQLNRFWEDKNKGMAEFAKVGVPTKPSMSGAFATFNYQTIVNQWDYTKLVIQKPRGMAGSTTYFVETPTEWQELSGILHNTLVKITPYIEGDPFTINCLLNNTGVYHGYPMFQITGDKRFTRYSGGTCGVDMTGGRTFDAGILQKLDEIVHLIGTALKKTDFWGWFGLDFLVTPKGEIVIIEINPRFTASISIFSQAQHYFLESSFWQGYIDKKKVFPDMVKPLPVTSLILRNTATESVKINNSLSSGIYEIDETSFKHKKQTTKISDLCSLPSALTSFLVVAKSVGTEIQPDGEFATIVAPRSAVDMNGNIDDSLGKIADFVTMVLTSSEK